MAKCKRCDNPVKARGLCCRHYHKVLREERKTRPANKYERQGSQCLADGCGVKPNAKGYCGKHYQRWVKYGDPSYTKHSKEYGAGKDWYVGKDGYVIRWAGRGHPNATGHGNLYQHRDVMSKLIGRPLTSSENVHHKNGDRSDNRPENLELWVKGQPAGQRVQDKVRNAAKLIIDHYSDARKLESDVDSFDNLMANLVETLRI